MTNESKGMLLGVIAVSAFGLTLPATRILTSYLDPVFIGLGRAVFASLFAGLILIYFRVDIPSRKYFSRLCIVALGVIVGFPVLSSWAMQYVPASHGGVVLGLLPLATSVAGVVITRERPSKLFWLVGVAGSSLVVGYALIQGSGELQGADIALLAAVLAAAIGYAVGAKLSQELGGWQVICWALILALPFILIPAFLFRPESFEDIPLSGFVSFLYLSLVSQLVAFFLWYKGLALGGIARVSQTQLVQPFITILASFLILKEIIDIETIIFATMVVISVWLGKKMPIYQK